AAVCTPGPIRARRQRATIDLEHERFAALVEPDVAPLSPLEARCPRGDASKWITACSCRLRSRAFPATARRADCLHAAPGGWRRSRTCSPGPDPLRCVATCGKGRLVQSTPGTREGRSDGISAT